MANLIRNFLSGRMNKVYDERVVPNGEYIDAMNIRMGSTEKSEIGVIENTKGNEALTYLAYTDGTKLSTDALCIGAIADSAKELIYWFVHDPAFVSSTTGKLDMIVSFNVFTNILTYHVVSTDDGSGVNTTLNFSEKYLITGVNIIEDLLFFTDDYNPPRFINTKRNYPNPIAFIDQFSAESILVIKKPPTEAPFVQPIITGGQQNFMDTRFICFAYRYRYADGEYSATSQWSQPAFIPQPFDFSLSSFLNEGMVNICNAAKITYNSGGPLVVGIDLLFKEANNNIIKIIEKLDKGQLGFSNNTNYQYVFDNSKIFTIISEAEILRLYDNVPRFAKAQTIMGNRLMYGNYVDGYNLIDIYDNPISLDYFTSLITEAIGETNVPDSTSSSTYNINGAKTVNDCIFNIDLSSVNLVSGASLSFDITISHGGFSGTVTPTNTTSNINISFTFFLSQDYTSVYQMATSTEFQDAIGTIANIKPVYDPVPGNPTSCDGTTFTDKVNCVLPTNLSYSGGSLTKVGSGISAVGQPIEIITTPASSTIGLKVTAMKYVDVPSAPVDYAYEYYSISYGEATFQEIATPQSLHSNRGYEIGIVYMDEFNRASTALVSLNNTEYVPCSNSDTKNSIRVTIPTTQIAPYWAKRYKFVIKPDQEKYDTIYSSIFFLSPTSNDVYFLLEGENARKVEQGDRFVVKSDSSGPTKNCVYATVLEKEAKAQGFITPATGVVPPGGTYMKINPNSFSVITDPNAIVAPGTRTIGTYNSNQGPIMVYPMNIETSPGTWTDYSVPAGSRIKITITTQRLGPGDGNRLCEKRIYTWDQTFISSGDYDNMKEWWDGDNIGQFINNGTSDVGAGACPVGNQYFSATLSSPSSIGYTFCTNYWQFSREAGPGDGKLSLCVRAVQACSGANTEKRKSSIIMDIQVFRATSTFVFETEPDDALPDVFFENNLSFEVDSNGNHMGNVQNQDIGLGIPAIVDTEFFNCFAFGNGVESYKIRDSIVGRSFNLGNRVTTVSSQDYKETDRFADITYSGVYNPETNLNKLNEFNPGLLNYKNLELSFGEIYILDGRETDVLVLQEDKISYVLAGKNLLSDSAAGGVVTSVPEVLGTQIARTEKYGITFNPESYVQWGYDRFFTDAKRGAVLQLRGDSYSNEQLSVISEMNMRTWFRDEFIASFPKQKLGGYDPYMNEYVLVMTDRDLPENPLCLACGVSQTFTLTGEDPQAYCVDLGPLVGESVVTYNVISIDPGVTFNITGVYNSLNFSSGDVSTSGSFVINKSLNYVDIVNMSIAHTGSLVLEVTVNCPDAKELNIVEVVVTNDFDSGDNLHVEYRYTNGPYIGSLQSRLVTFASGSANPLVSWYNMVTGYVGSAAFPPTGSTVRLQTNKIGFDNYDFDPANNKFRYLSTNTLYTNTTGDISNLLAASNIASPINGGGNTYYADFTLSLSKIYLYLIWDLRKATPVDLCYGASVNEACCDCEPCTGCYELTISSLDDVVMYFPLGLCDLGGVPYTLNMPLEDSPVKLCIPSQNYQILSGNPTLTRDNCGCTACTLECDTWYIYDVELPLGVTVFYEQCGGGSISVNISSSTFICATKGTTPLIVGSASIEKVLYCQCCDAEVTGVCNGWVVINSSPTTCQVQYMVCGSINNFTTVTVGPNSTEEICCDIRYHPTVISGTAELKMSQCGCPKAP